MGVRREGREAAVQYLYQQDLNEGSELGTYYKMRGISPSARRFSDELIEGLTREGSVVDDLIRQHAQNYEFHRISAVDRNILRVAIYEMLHCPQTPPVVAINEAIEIAKKYSTEESGRFVNGVLDKIRGGLNRPARTVSQS
jgi:N utilization substance protein B